MRVPPCRCRCRTSSSCRSAARASAAPAARVTGLTGCSCCTPSVSRPSALSAAARQVAVGSDRMPSQGRWPPPAAASTPRRPRHGARLPARCAAGSAQAGLAGTCSWKHTACGQLQREGTPLLRAAAGMVNTCTCSRQAHLVGGMAGGRTGCAVKGRTRVSCFGCARTGQAVRAAEYERTECGGMCLSPLQLRLRH